jgi:hypothetical protein
MHRITRRSVLVLVVIGALVAGGAAYTNSLNDGATTNQIGYSQETVAGATLGTVSYGFNSDASTVTSVTLSFTGGPYVGQKLEVGLGTGTQAVDVCSGTTGATTGGVITDATATPSVTCDLTTAGVGIDSASAQSLKVLVTNP